MGIDVEKLISEVEKRVPLYDSKHPQYHDKKLKKDLWEDICTELNPNWSLESPEDKIMFGKECQKRWNSLRDCFRRELNLLKITPSSCPRKKKKKYIFFDNLLFLKPHTQSMETEFSSRTDSLEESDALEETDSMGPLEARSTSPPYQPTPSHQPKALKRKIGVDDEILSFLKETNSMLASKQRSEMVDEDEAFLFSLLSSFKKYNTDQKMLLRIEIMKTIVSFKPETQ